MQSPAKRTYRHLWERLDKSSQELFIRGTGIRASSIWLDRFVEHLSHQEIADGRSISVESVYEALQFCEDEAELIAREAAEDARLCEEHGSTPIYPQR